MRRPLQHLKRTKHTNRKESGSSAALNTQSNRHYSERSCWQIVIKRFVNVNWLERLQAFHGENQHANCFLSNCWCCSLWWMEVFFHHCYHNIKELSLLLEWNAQCREFACSTGCLVFARMSNYWGDAYSPHKNGRVIPPSSQRRVLSSCARGVSYFSLHFQDLGLFQSTLPTIPWEAAADHRWFTYE